MKNIPFARRMSVARKSFLREILKDARQPGIISFAGGLPNPTTFPIKEMEAATSKALRQNGANMLQYAPSQGHLPLRQFIVDHYQQKFGLAVEAKEVLITTGSQQGLSLISQILIDPGDGVILESPSYMGAIQSFSLTEPQFVTVPLREDGVDVAALTQAVKEKAAKLFYFMSNFQNPSGVSYSLAKRQAVAQVLSESHTFYVEDDPYRELRYEGEDLPSQWELGNRDGFLLGSFSKIVAPGMRLGWIVTSEPLIDKLIIAKQAADLHSSQFVQEAMVQYLLDNDIEAQIERIKGIYGAQRAKMKNMLDECLPAGISYAESQGGMFFWLTMPASLSAMKVLPEAIKCKVIFAPGAPFFVDGSGDRHIRLSYSNVSPDLIEKGMLHLTAAMVAAMK